MGEVSGERRRRIAATCESQGQWRLPTSRHRESRPRHNPTTRRGAVSGAARAAGPHNKRARSHPEKPRVALPVARRKRSLRCGHITSCTYPHSGHFIEVRGLLTRNFTTQRPKTPTVWTRHKLGRGPWLVICTQESARTRIFACGRITNHTEPHARSVPAVSWRSGLEPHGGDTSDTPQRRAKNLGFDRDAENITLRSRAPCCFVVSELPRVAGRIGPSRVAPTPQDNPTTNQSETSLVSDAPWTKEAEEGPKSSSPRAIRF